MKTKFRIRQLCKNLIFIFLISFHFHLGFCRPPPASNVDNTGAAAQRVVESSTKNSKGHHHLNSQVRPVYDLRNVGPTEIYYTMRGDRRILKNNDTLILYKDLFGFEPSGDVDGDNDVAIDVDAVDVIVDKEEDDEEGSRHHHHQHQVVPFRERNLVRKRRHPESHKSHRRRRRKHRLVLKARDRNHLSEGDGDLKDRRDRFLIKSDSPGYVITSANEVKKDWCRTIPLRQKVSEPYCKSKVVQNNFCYGQCNSFFIPHTGRTDNKVAFQSCAFCKPFKQHWGNVTLNCPGRNPPKIEKTVLFVETCRCITEVFQ